MNITYYNIETTIKKETSSQYISADIEHKDRKYGININNDTS